MYNQQSMQEYLKTKRKNELEVATEILRVATKKAEKEDILTRCHLSPTLLEKYLYALLELGLLTTDLDNKSIFRTTDKGLEILRVFYYLKSVMKIKTIDFLLVRMLGRLVTNKKAGNVKPYIL
jgi:predicted transcriptional regulator